MRAFPLILTAAMILLFANVGTSGPVNAAQQITSGLVLNLDASVASSYAGSVWTDQSSNGFNATAYGAPTLNSSDGSMNFNGTSQYFDLGNSNLNFNSLNPFTIQVIFSAANASLTGNLVARQNTAVAGDYFLSLSGGKMDNYVENTPWGIAGTTAIQGNTKYVATMTYDSSGYLTGYLNGSIDATKTYFGSISSSAIRLLIGAALDHSNPTGFFQGKIYSVRIYNRALSASEVQQNYLIASNQAQVSGTLSILGTPTSIAYRSPTSLRLTSAQPASVTFYLNSKAIPGCKNLRIVDTNTALTCLWKPSTHGLANIKATISPTSNLYDATTLYYSIPTIARSGNR